MILIADSGGTKTDWMLLHSKGLRKGEIIATFHTQGITPIHQTPDVIRHILGQELMSQLSTFPRAQLIDSGELDGSLLSKVKVFFYGSGCTPAHVPQMTQMLGEVFSPQQVEVHSDLMAAARALCQREAGIACILGTGANSCLYDGNTIVQNTPALGYILGDEGGGAVLGRMFMNAIFKNPQFAGIRDEYLKKEKLTQADIIQRVYREPLANRFLATTSLFIAERMDNPLLRQLVVDNFRQFFRCNIVPYQHPELPVHFVGSMAHAYPEALQEAARMEGFHVGTIVQSPIDGLVRYHSV
ncbi:MAG: ATPase [Prevotella sp.]|jgi:N-acetylglucosamine kinase-like BadF-type ATPase|nr:ATPase [Prevotella sp.]